MIKRQKVLVAGATGFLGKRIINMLQKQKILYISASRSLGVNFLDLKQTLTFFEKYKPTTVIHSAAFIGGIKFGIDHAGEIYYKNIIMTTNLIEASRLCNVQKFISPMANCVYPSKKNKKLKEDELWDGPLHESVMPYGMVRKAQWAQTWAYKLQYDMTFINLIFPNMYGPGDYFDPERSHAIGALLFKFVKAKKENIPEVIVWGTGNPIREWLYVDDGAKALVKAIKVNYSVDPINIGTGKGISIKELAFLIKNIVGYKGKITFDTLKPDGAPYKIMNINKCKKIFKWYPKTGIEEGIRKTYYWYMKNSL